jgi:hypothetical protein
VIALFSPTPNTVITAEADKALRDALSEEEVGQALREILTRHYSGDWGEVDKHDHAVNEAALRTGARILSAYTVAGIKLWIITDAAYDSDRPRVRQVTTILRPEDY